MGTESRRNAVWAAVWDASRWAREAAARAAEGQPWDSPASDVATAVWHRAWDLAGAAAIASAPNLA